MECHPNTMLLNSERAAPTEACLLRGFRDSGIIHLSQFAERSKEIIFLQKKKMFSPPLLCCNGQKQVKPYSRSCSSDATAPRKQSEDGIFKGEKIKGKPSRRALPSPFQTQPTLWLKSERNYSMGEGMYIRKKMARRFRRKRHQRGERCRVRRQSAPQLDSVFTSASHIQTRSVT